MDPVLVKLLRFRLRGALRRSFRGLKTVRGMIFFLFGLGAFLLWIGPQFLLLFIQHGQSDPEVLRDVLPVGLFGLSLMAFLGGSRQEGICFTPAEVDFLFSGPFTRRNLLLYKLASGIVGSLFGALFISFVLMRYASHWLAAFVGAFLALVFVQFLTTLLVLIGQTMAQQIYTLARKAVLLVFFGLVIVIAARGLPTFFDRGFVEAAHVLRVSTFGYWLFLPLEPLVRTIVAERIFPDFIGWAAAGTALDLVMLMLVVRIDVNFLESSVSASQKRYLLMQRRRHGRMFVKPKMSWRLPAFPWLGGAGPIAWRQLTTALRGLHGLLPFFLIVLGFAVMPLFFQAMKSPGALGALIGQIGVFTMIMTRAVAFDFRGDLDCMDWLKSLPLRPIAITLGQLVTPVLLLTAIHAMFLGSALAFTQESSAVLIAALLFSPLFNFLLFGLDYLLFLLFPSRMAAATPGDLQFIGRTMLEMFAKMIVLACCCGASAAVGWAGYWISGGSWAAALGMAGFVLLFCGCLIVPCIAWAYCRFDVSIDTPA